MLEDFIAWQVPVARAIQRRRRYTLLGGKRLWLDEWDEPAPGVLRGEVVAFDLALAAVAGVWLFGASAGSDPTLWLRVLIVEGVLVVGCVLAAAGRRAGSSLLSPMVLGAVAWESARLAAPLLAALLGLNAACAAARLLPLEFELAAFATAFVAVWALLVSFVSVSGLDPRAAAGAWSHLGAPFKVAGVYGVVFFVFAAIALLVSRHIVAGPAAIALAALPFACAVFFVIFYRRETLRLSDPGGAWRLAWWSALYGGLVVVGAAALGAVVSHVLP